MEPDPPPNPLLNPCCRLSLIIKSASFLKDVDTFGKQDPYIQFLYNGKSIQTEAKDGAGKQAEWNEKFSLSNIQEQVLSSKRLAFEAFDKDTTTSDFLGRTSSMSLSLLVADDEQKEH